VGQIASEWKEEKKMRKALLETVVTMLVISAVIAITVMLGTALGDLVQPNKAIAAQITQQATQTIKRGKADQIIEEAKSRKELEDQRAFVRRIILAGETGY
jgi:Na+/H+-dicarboxylate symporter